MAPLASVVVGLYALGSAWAPVVNLASIPLIFLGMIFALVGALVVRTSKRTGYLWPVAGAATNLVAFVLVIVINLVLLAVAAKNLRD